MNTGNSTWVASILKVAQQVGQGSSYMIVELYKKKQVKPAKSVELPHDMINEGLRMKGCLYLSTLFAGCIIHGRMCTLNSTASLPLSRSSTLTAHHCFSARNEEQALLWCRSAPPPDQSKLFHRLSICVLCLFLFISFCMNNSSCLA